MRDYSFGNFLHELRERRGLSQYQLGRLVGVSNKAVSKWENGSAKPQSRILYKLSDILGVTVDELLACKYRSACNGNQKGVFAMKKELWEKAYDLLKDRYGEVMPVEVLNRYLSEYAEFKDTDMIVYFDLFGKIRSLAENSGEHIYVKGGIGASFVAYIMGATEVNPLRPHYFCPRCRKFEFADEVLCGWDLPAKKCECGNDFLRDGHNIPFETLRNWICKNVRFNLSVSHGIYHAVKEFIHEYFTENTVVSLIRKEHPNIEKLVIADDAICDLNGRELVFEECYDRIKDYPSITLMQNDDLDLFKLLEEETNTSFIDAEYIHPSVLEAFRNGDKRGIPEFENKFVCGMIDEVSPESFNDLIQIAGFAHGSYVWVDNAQHQIKNGIPAGELIAYSEDVFNHVRSKMNETNTGYAYKIMEDTRRGLYARYGISSEMRQQFSAIGLDDRFTESIGKIGYAFPKSHGVLIVKHSLILMWFKINYPEIFEKVMCNS